MNTLASLIQEHTEGTQNTEEQLSAEVSTNGVEASGTVTTTEPTPEAQPEVVMDITTTNLNVWWEANQNSFPASMITSPRMNVQACDPAENRAFTIPHPEGGEYGGFPKRLIVMWEDADETSVLNLPATQMDVFKNGLKIVHQFQGINIRSYCVKTGLTNVFTVDVAGVFIPYHVAKMKKSAAGINFVAPPSIEVIQEKLLTSIDTEATILQYPQIAKAIAELPTVQSAITWFINRQVGIRDVNHLMQIDKVMSWLIVG